LALAFTISLKEIISFEDSALRSTSITEVSSLLWPLLTSVSDALLPRFAWFRLGYQPQTSYGKLIIPPL